MYIGLVKRKNSVEKIGECLFNVLVDIMVVDEGFAAVLMNFE